ncbi:MAG: hypothetical protein K8W52_05415 [Deltaproteobacteria bacterium]|nr:hypothetical protein [Deltaproteobacteria bacterium]
MPLAVPRSQLGAWAAIVLVGYAIHAAVHVAHGETWDLLWACNVATLLLAIGSAIRQPRVVGVALCWLSFGTPLWLLDLLNGGPLTASSLLIHVGALGVAVRVARTLTVPRGTWLVALIGLAVVMALSRALTPPAMNVNLAFGVYTGWEGVFPDERIYFACLFAVSALGFVAVEQAMRWRAPAPDRR